MEEIIDYNWMHPLYGTAMMSICPQFKDNRLDKLTLDLISDGKTNRRTIIFETQNITCIVITSPLGIPPAYQWINVWCQEHNTLCQRWYVPRGTCQLRIHDSSDTLNLTFRLVEK